MHRDVLAIAAAAPFGDVLDVGCGRGQLALALLEAGFCRSVLGLDGRSSALQEAALAATGLAFVARVQDFVRDTTLPAADCVLLIDVLYQLPAAAQDRLLRAAAAAARERVVLRTLDPARGWRSALAMAAERVGRRFWPNAGAHVAPPRVESLTTMLHDAGFATRVTPCWRGTPFANVLIDAVRAPLVLSGAPPPDARPAHATPG